MDPLAAPLACDCVQGYAQREYEQLAAYLQRQLRLPVTVEWSESLVTAVEQKTEGRADIIIGKDSVVRSDAARAKLAITPVASLSDKDGLTIQTGLFVVRSDSPAQSLLDLDGFTFLFGPDNCDEKWSAPRAMLKKLELDIADASKTCDSCSVAAKELLALPASTQAVAVISSYAQPLLEGCGTIKKGDLRVVGQSEAVPFITCFLNERLPEATQTAVRAALLEMKSPEMLQALETRKGFVPYDQPAKTVAATTK
jgi:ABC-type phosphate/phosphonate transport system substrate-binding protein